MIFRILLPALAFVLIAPHVLTVVAENGVQGLRIRSMHVLVDPGGRVDWSHRRNTIAYDAPNTDGFYDIYTMKPKGAAGQKCLTCDKPRISQFHNGNPAWHPSGKYLAFQAVDPNLYRRLPHAEETKRNLTEPGVGIANNIWVYDLVADEVFKLTDVSQRARLRGGVLHPHFSPDGTLLIWSERIGGHRTDSGGEWEIRLAEFTTTSGKPRLQNIRNFQPGSDVSKRLYETHGFSPDGSALLYTANADGQTKYGFDIYLYGWRNDQLKRLTSSEKIWDEHAHFTPDGKNIVWMSSKGFPAGTGKLKTELWFMNPDGSNQQRLTSLNIPGSSHYQPDPHGVVAADFAWGVGGKQMALYLIPNGGRSSLGMPGRILLLEF